ncbi:MAG TPA: oxidoreductase [Pseudonocardiaceae bacterium]|jgi:aryl-alcohol dehydrogenase-like predicted oxidoreductase|nr:oxidoreductase [Pseudonocardiaceae bacterium]
MATDIDITTGPAGAAGTAQLAGATVARMGYGTMRLPAWPFGAAPSHEDAIAVLRRAVELGVNHIDTAYFYARDGVRANDLIKAALYPYPANLVIVTKLATIADGDDINLPESERLGHTEAGLRTAVENNLTSLGVDQLDVVNLRVGAPDGTVEESLAEPLTALLKLRDEGLVREIGVSNVTAAQFAEALEIAPVACVQNHYNLTERTDDAILDSCAERGIPFVPFFPVGGFQPLAAERIAAVAARHGATVPQIALAWLLARSPNVLTIAGTSSVDHLEQNVAAATIKLSDADLAELNAD